MSPSVLAIEASTAHGSVAVLRGEEIVAAVTYESIDRITGVRSEALAPAVSRCLSNAAMTSRDLAAIICGAGPGGFTSLRSAAAMAKGMAQALGIDIHAVSSLELLARSVESAADELMVALPAGRGEWFAADAAKRHGAFATGAMRIVPEALLRELARERGLQVAGPGLEIDVLPRAERVSGIVGRTLAAGSASLDSWEPQYGRLAEAQVKWEAAHGRALGA